MADRDKAAAVPERIREAGGLREGVARDVARDTGVPEAEVYGVGSFFHLLSEPDVRIRICQGLSCRIAGAETILDQAKQAGLPAAGCACLAACDRPVAGLRDRDLIPDLTAADIEAAQGDWKNLRLRLPGTADSWSGVVGPDNANSDSLAMHLAGDPDFSGSALTRAAALGPEAVIDQIEKSGLQGRGGAGFPAAIKWKGVRAQQVRTRYVVLNADEGEPGTFKDREVMVRRPDLVLEGLAIAARTVGTDNVYMYLRGEFGAPWRAMETALTEFEGRGLFEGIGFHFHAGHGAYICGEETALFEALEGKRGMPRLRPPFPTEKGLWGKPTLIHNVETIACVPAIVRRGGDWFRGLGRGAAGTKLYSLSGHVKRPGVYEMPLGTTLDELVAAAGGYVGRLKAFLPGGASAGFLPASESGRPLEFKALAEVGSMLGSAGVTVLNDSVDLVDAVRAQLAFFEAESCGQCAPCRIGTRFQRESLDSFVVARGNGGDRKNTLRLVDPVAWEMNEGSICGLGQAASLPLTSAMRWFPEEFQS
jgi:NADH:ubiquinone oxidoreductase subunit F (NADH-binding)